MTIVATPTCGIHPASNKTLRLMCVVNKPDIVCIVESWLCSDIDDVELSINVFRLDRNRHGGGILLFVKSQRLF